MSGNILEEFEQAKQEIKKLRVALRAEQLRTKISSEYTNFGLWEYDIATDICYQYKKLSGRFENNLEPIIHFRDSILSWGSVCTEDLPAFKHFCDDLKAGKKEVFCDVRMINDNCDIVWFRYEGKTVYDDAGNPIKVVGRTLDVTQEKGGIADDTNERKDPLTNLYSPDLFRDCVAEKRSGAKHYNNAALLCVGIDNFRGLVSRLGLEYGDYVQKTVGKILSGVCATERDSLVTRVRDGEFLLYLSFTDNKTLDNTARRIIHLIREYIYEGEPVTASVGVSQFKTGKKLDDVYKKASVALAEAQKSGGVCFMHYSPAMSMGLYNYPVNLDENIDVLNMSSGAAKVYNLLLKAFCSAQIKEAIKTAGQCIGASNIFIFSKEDGGYRRSMIFNSCDRPEGKTPSITVSCGEDGLAAAFGNDNSLRIVDHDLPIGGIHLENGAVCAECRAVRFNGAVKMMFAVVFDSRFELSEQDLQIIDVIEDALTAMNISYETEMSERSSQRLRSTAINNHRMEGFSIIPLTFEVDEVGDNAAEHYGLCKGDICYKKLYGREAPCENCPAVQLAQNGGLFASSAYYNNSERRWLDVTASVDENSNGETRYVVSYTDITDCLGKIRMTDGLTGLMTFSSFTAEALQMTADPENSNDGLFTAVINIADFNRINEEKGYEAGNAILITMADIMQRCIGSGELLCRSEDARFTALFRNADRNEFDGRINLLLNSLQKQIYERLQVHIFLLVGVCDMNDEPIGIMSSIDRAIQAQKTIRDRAYYHETLVVYYDGVMREKIKEHRFIEANMQSALENGEFHVYYQPKVCIETGKIVGAEALVRWIRDDGTIISPGKFVPIFEENGFVTEMDFAIYRRSIADIAKWLRMGIDVPLISLNVSRRHLADEDFCQKFNALVDGIGVPHDYIELEITESLLTENLDKLIEVATWFKERGYRISIDDFGSGYSSLNLITMLPFDTLKIDGGFFLRNDLTEKNRKVITSVVSLAKSLNLTTVSEGVETQRQVDFLKELGCDMIQGFFYYKPMPCDDFERVIEAQGSIIAK